MKLAVNNLIVPLSLALFASQIAPLSAQSLSDSIGTQPHTFAASAAASLSPPPAKWTRHHQLSTKHDDVHKAAAAKWKAHKKRTTSPNDATASISDLSVVSTPDQTAAALPSTPAQIGTALPLAPAQIARHHAKMLALRAAHRRAHHRTALNGFDLVGSKQATDLDSLTRDGSTTQTSATDLGAHDLSIGGAIARAVAALALVLALAYGALKALRRRGIGVATDQVSNADAAHPSGFGLRMQSGNPAALDQFQKAIELAQAKQGIDQHEDTGVQKIAKSIEDLQILGSQELPGTAHTLYKVKIGDRVLLLGGSLSGALTSLTEWDIETKPETEQAFETVLNQMTMSVTPPPAAPVVASTPHLAGGSQADALRTATQRLSRSARRMAEVGRTANDAS